MSTTDQATGPLHFLYRFFYASAAPEDRKYPLWLKIALIVLLFTITRALAAYGFHYRGVDWLAVDPGGYIAQADYIAQHGHISPEPKVIYRQFPGLSMLMVMINPLIGNMTVSGYVMVFACGLAAVLFIQYLFDDFRLTILSLVFLPYTIVCSATIFSEAPTILCFLTGFWAVRDLRDRPVAFTLAILVAGFSLVLRQTAFLFLYPMLFLLSWKRPGGTFGRAVLVLALASVPTALYLTWNWLSIHELFPQYKMHEDLLLSQVTNNRDPNRYSAHMFDLPFRSLWEGLTDPTERLTKRANVLAAFVTVVIAFFCLIWTWRHDRKEETRLIAMAFLAALSVHCLFHLSLGGNFGYKWLDRHFSQVNPIIDWALFYRKPLRWVWIVAIIVMATLFAMNAGQGVRSIGPFKPPVASEQGQSVAP